MKAFLISALVLCPVLFVGASPKTVQCKKFEVTFTITYNEMTLADAALMERKIREQFSDACKVDVKVKEVASTETGITEFEWIDGTNIIQCPDGILDLSFSSTAELNTNDLSVIEVDPNAIKDIIKEN